jgi:hypothetical protein
MADYPHGAFVTGAGVKNAALEFKTCIYKATDVPRETRRDDIAFARPITCFEWQNIYVYDFAQGKFQTQLVDFPTGEEPRKRVNAFLIVMLASLFSGLAIVTIARLRLVLQRQ